MSAILDKLLKKQRVDWVKLGEVAEIGTGSSNRQDEDENGIYPFYVRSKNILKSNTFQFDETAIIIPGEGGIGEIFHYAQGKYALHQRAYRIHITSSKLETKYLFYVMAHSFKKYILTKSVGATATSIRKPMLEQFEIPIPPLDVQAEIVRILDAFTTITAELTAELNMRERQYQYYRDKLLSFSDVSIETDSNRQQQTALCERLANNVKQNHQIIWKSLGELGQLIRGNGLQKSDFTETGFPAIHYGQIYTFYGTFADTTKSFVSENLAKKLKKAQNGDVLLAGTSENIQDVMKPLGWLGDEIAISGDMFAYRPNAELDTKYLTYLLQTTDFQKYKEKYAHGTKVTRLNAEKFLRFEITVPSLNEQKRIVEILDKFETLTHSITEGLPKEIALRQQQYEYYREQLLDFAKN